MSLKSISLSIALAGQSFLYPTDPRFEAPGKKDPTTFYLVRHGETFWNEKKEIVTPFGEKCMGPLIQGSSDIELNAKGELQAKEAAKKISDLKLPIDAIYASPLKRAAKTAEIIASEVGLISIEEPGFTACSWGICEGRTKEYRKEKYFYDFNKNYRGPGWEMMPTKERWNLQIIEGAESMQSVIERMKLAFARIAADSNSGSSIFVATHDENIKSCILHCDEEVIEKARLDQDFPTISALEKRDIENCSIHKFNYDLETNQMTYCGEIKVPVYPDEAAHSISTVFS